MGGARGLTRLSSGIPSLDRITGGGLPAESLVVVSGPPGAGKSILTLQILAEAARHGPHALYVVTVHQSATKLRVQYGTIRALGLTGALDRVQFLELDLPALLGSLNDAVNSIVNVVQRGQTSMLAIDSFRVVGDLAQNRAETWRLLGALASELTLAQCTGILVGEYSLPADLDRPEMMMADLLLHLDVERAVHADIRTLRVYKARGGPYVEGRHAYRITDEGIEFVSGAGDGLPEGVAGQRDEPPDLAWGLSGSRP